LIDSVRRPKMERTTLVKTAVWVFTAVACGLALTVHLQAANRTWDGGGTPDIGGNFLWSDAFNWDGNLTAPVGNDSLTFGGILGTPQSNDLAADTVFTGVTFNAGTGAFAIGGNRITLGGNITDNATSAEVINLALLLNGDRTVTVGTGGTLTLGGVISQDATNRSLTKLGAGNLIFGAANTYAGNTILDGGGTLTYTADNTGVKVLTLGVATAVPFSTTPSSVNLSSANLTATGLTVQVNSSSANTFTIGNTKTLTVNGAVRIGPNTNGLVISGVNTVVNMTGGGSFVVNDTTNNFLVGQLRNNNDAGTDPTATLDLTGLNNFSYTATGAGELRVGYGGNITGILRLANTTVSAVAPTNTITAAAIQVGNSNNQNNGGASTLSLGGGSNVLNAATINLGGGKSAGTMNFLGSSGSVTIAGTTGGSSTANITVGAAGSATASGNFSNMLFAGHQANINAGTLVIGQLTGSTAGGTATGIVTFDTGTMNVTNLRLGVSNGTATGTGATSSGTFTIGGPTAGSSATGVLNVSTQFFLAQRQSANQGANSGTFILNGGTVNTSTDIVDASTAGTSTTTLTIAGGTLNMNGHAIGSAAAPITNVNLPAAGQTATLSSLGGAGINGNGLDLTTAGTLILAGNHTYTGNTAIDNGTLVVTGSTPAASPVMVNAGILSGAGDGSTTGKVGALTIAGGAAIHPGSSSADGVVGTLTTGNLTFNAGADLRVDLIHTDAASHDIVNVVGTATFGGGTITPGAVTDGGIYTILTSSSPIVYNSTPTLVTPADTRPTFSLTPLTNSITVTVGGTAPLTLNWAGTVSDGSSNYLWDLHTTSNWTNGSPQQFFNLDRVVFGDGPTNRTVTLNTAVSPGDVSFTNTGANDYTITGTGSIDGSTSLTKNGSGTATIGVTSNYSGATNVNAGTLVITGQSNGTGKYSIASGATLKIGNGLTSGNLGTGNVANEGTLVFNRSDAPLAITNIISGGGAVQAIGTGTIELSAVNTYAGATTIQNGTLKVDTFNALGLPAGGVVAISAGGTLDLSGIPTANIAGGFGVKEVDIAGTGVAGLGAIVNGGMNQQNAFQNITLTAAATIGGTSRYDLRGGTPVLNLTTFDLHKTGSNQFSIVNGTINSNTTGGGSLIVDQGILSIEGTTSSTGSGTITFNAGTIAQFFQNSGAFNRTIVINGGSLATNDIVTMGNNAANNTATVASPIQLAADLAIQGNATSTLNLTGIISNPGSPHGLIKNGTSTLILSGANTFTGGVTINDGVVQVGNAAALTTNVVTFGPGAASTAVLRLGGVSGTAAGVNTDAGSPGSPIIENASTTAATLTVSNTSANTFAGTIQDGAPTTGTAAALSLAKAGAGTLLLTGTNTYTGSTTVSGGTLQLGSASSLPMTTVVTIGGASTSGTLDLNGFGATISGLSSGALGSSNIITNNSVSTPAVLTYQNGTTIFGGVIKDNGGVTPTTGLTITSGSLTLSAANTYRGDTTISGGKLIVNGSTLSSGNVIVNNGATLAGSGSVGNVTLNGGSTLTPGTSPGNITMSSLTLSGGDIRYELPAPDPNSPVVHDQVTVTGAATFNGGTLTLLNPVLPAGGTYTLMTYASHSGSDPTLGVPSNTRTNYHYTVGPTAITIAPTGSALSLTWTGAAPGDGTTWDTSTAASSQNWSNSGGPTSNDTFFNLDAVTLGNGPTNRNVTVNGSVTPQSVVVNNSLGSDYTISGVGSIDGLITTLTKSGTGALILATNNTYQGGTTINDTGTLQVGNGGGTGSLGSGNVVGTASGTGANLVFNRNGTFSEGGAISGKLNLTLTGTGSLTFGAANTYTGFTSIANGILTLGAVGALPTGTALTLGDVSNHSGTLDLNGFNASVAGFSTVGTGANALNNSGSGGTLTYTASTSVFNGTVQGPTSISVTGGSLTITGADTRTGASSVSNGATLQIGNGNTGGIASGNITADGTFTLNRTDSTLTLSQVIAGAATGQIQIIGTGTTSLTGTNTYSGVTTIQNGTVQVTPSASLGAVPGGAVNISSGGTLDISGNATANNLNFGAKQFNIAGTGVGGNGVIVNSGALAQQNAFQQIALTADATIGGTGRFDVRGGTPKLDLAAHTLTKIGSNQFTVVGATVTDGNIIVNQGTFSIETTSSVLANGSDSTSITYNAGTNAQFFSNTAATSTVTRRMIINGAGVQMGSASNGNTSNIGSPITLNADLTVTNLNNTTATSILNLAGVIKDGAASHGITKTGPTTLILSGNNTYTGPTTVNAGVVQLGASERIANSSNLVLGAGTFSAAGFNETINKLQLNANSTSGTPSTIDFGGTGALNSTLTFASSSDFASIWPAGSLLQIKNWDGTGHNDHIFVGTNPAGQANSGLSHAQLHQIQFIFADSSPHTASLGANGELLPDLTPPALLTLGDVNQDMHVDIADVSSQMTMLSDIATYQNMHNFTQGDVASVADLNADNLATNTDVQALIVLLANGGGSAPGGGSLTAVPEPSSIMLVGLGCAILFAARFRKQIPLAAR
jgi:fibronectin-binding autotransporter adhesin